jgi:pyruvate,water dikinase
MEKSMDRFIHTFGHLSDSGNDFSKPQWQENQPLIRNMITDYKTKPFNVVQNDTSIPNVQEGIIFRYILRNALEYREYRERVNYLYTWGYSLFRQYFLSVSAIWKQKGYIDDEHDIFYLSHQEIIDFQKGNTNLSKLQELIRERKFDIQRLTEIRLPSVIVGDSLPPVINDTDIQTVIRGIPASRGYCTGRISLIRSLNDFSKEKANRILVIPHSDASWTPLFHSATGIISESGGGLSHCAIIAREYGIPAVVSVKDALKLKEDTLVTLDGDKGEVTLLG